MHKASILPDVVPGYLCPPRPLFGCHLFPCTGGSHGQAQEALECIFPFHGRDAPQGVRVYVYFMLFRAQSSGSMGAGRRRACPTLPCVHFRSKRTGLFGDWVSFLRCLFLYMSRFHAPQQNFLRICVIYTCVWVLLCMVLYACGNTHL